MPPPSIQEMATFFLNLTMKNNNSQLSLHIFLQTTLPTKSLLSSNLTGMSILQVIKVYNSGHDGKNSSCK